MAPCTFYGLVEPTDEELQRPFDVIMGANLRRPPEVHPIDGSEEPDDELAQRES